MAVLTHLVGRTFNWIVRFLPLLLRVVVGLLRNIGMLVIMTISSLWVGVPQATTTMATDLTESILGRGLPENWRGSIFGACRVFSILLIITGWIIFAYITVWIVNLIF
jgi:hypothetical protein